MKIERAFQARVRARRVGIDTGWFLIILASATAWVAWWEIIT